MGHYARHGLARRGRVWGTFAGVTATLVITLAVLVSAQSAPAPRVALAEEVFKDVQVLRGISADQFMGTMGVFSAAVGKNCTGCHGDDSAGDWGKYANDTPEKTTARRMVIMMQAINQTHFGGRQVVTCYTCHRTSRAPKVTPSLIALYGPPPDEPEDLVLPAPGAPPAAQIFDKYLKAVGSAERRAALTSYTAKGTYQGFSEDAKSQLELVARAPEQRLTHVRTGFGDLISSFDGAEGWVQAPPDVRPMPLTVVSGHELEGMKLQAALMFPGRIAQLVTNPRVGFPVDLNGRDAQVVQGNTPGGALATLFFDDESGLLVRTMTYSASPVGRFVTQFDFEDFRDVAGVKLPFKWTETWLNGKSEIQLTDLQPNVPVPPTRFVKPATPPANRIPAAR